MIPLGLTHVLIGLGISEIRKSLVSKDLKIVFKTPLSNVILVMATTEYIDPKAVDTQFALLRGVEVDDPNFYGLQADIEKNGVLQSILVRRMPDGTLSLIDGMQRISISKALLKKSIPAVILEDITDEEAELLQASMNAHRIQPSLMQYARYFKKLSEERGYKLSDLLRLMNKSKSWFYDVLRLNQLVPDAQALVEANEMSLTNATWLAKVPRERQSKLIEDARVLGSKEFIEAVKDSRKQSRTKTLGELAKTDNSLKPRYRPMKEILGNLQKFEEDKENNDDPRVRGWITALKWVIQMDQESLETRKV